MTLIPPLRVLANPVQQRRISLPPLFEDLGEAEQRLLLSIDRRLAALGPANGRRVNFWSNELQRLFLNQDKILEVLVHPLSAWADHLWQSPTIWPTPEYEFDACRRIATTIADLLKEKNDSLKDGLGIVATAFGLPGAVREHANYSAADGEGRRVEYPAPELLRVGLATLDERIRSQDKPRVWIALICLSGVLNIHPLRDGNGRVARALFNIVLEHSYLPLWHLWACSRGGFQLYQRGAETMGDWPSYIRYFASIVDVIERISGNGQLEASPQKSGPTAIHP